MTLRALINELLRDALVQHRPADPFPVKVQRSALQPGIDPHRLNQLSDEVEDEALIERLRK